MEALFELLGNPIVIFILIGILSSLFNKAKGNSQDNQNRRPVRPVRKPEVMSRSVEAQREHRLDPRQVSQRPAPARQVKAEQKSAELSEIQKVYQERKQQAENVESRQRTSVKSRLSPETSTGRGKLREDHAEPVFEFVPDQDRLIEGLIWAEVLGKPRAKEPYRPGRRE